MVHHVAADRAQNRPSDRPHPTRTNHNDVTVLLGSHRDDSLARVVLGCLEERLVFHLKSIQTSERFNTFIASSPAYK